MKIKDSEKINKYLDFARKPKKAEEHEGDGNTNNSWRARNSPQGLGEEIRKFEN